MAQSLDTRIQNLRHEAEDVLHNGHIGVLPCEDRKDGLYPNVDLSIWLRSCIEEVIVPKKGQLVVKNAEKDGIPGGIPVWLRGDLMMNGPGKFYFGTDVFQHLFDGSAIVQKYAIAEDGQVYYQSQFLKTKSFKVSKIEILHEKIIVSFAVHCLEVKGSTNKEKAHKTICSIFII